MPPRPIKKAENALDFAFLTLTESIDNFLSSKLCSIAKYRYYVMRGDWVEAGFDNAPDPRAIRLKYGRIGEEHTGENIPHLHREDKAQLRLTEEMAFQDFVAWLKSNVQSA